MKYIVAFPFIDRHWEGAVDIIRQHDPFITSIDATIDPDFLTNTMSHGISNYGVPYFSRILPCEACFNKGTAFTDLGIPIIKISWSRGRLIIVYRIIHELPGIRNLGWGGLPIIVTSDEVMSENHWQIASWVTKKIFIHGNECIILFLIR